MGQGRAFAVEIGTLGIGADQPVEIARLELMGVAGQRGDIADPVIAGAAPEYIVAAGERRQYGIAAGAAAGDDGALAIRETFADDMPGGVDAVIDIDDAPSALEPLAVGPAIAGAAAVIDIEHADASAPPVLAAAAPHRRC